jgi:hypothetical protein
VINLFKDIVTTGITPIEEYPKLKCTKFCKQSLENDNLYIPCEKPDIESINEVKVNVCIDDANIINTILGPKLVLHGHKNIKVIYTANNCEQSLHSAHWNVPFCDFILLDGMRYDECFSLVKNVFVGIEHACVNSFNLREVNLCIIFIICPLIKDRYMDTCYNPCQMMF